MNRREIQGTSLAGVIAGSQRRSRFSVDVQNLAKKRDRADCIVGRYAWHAAPLSTVFVGHSLNVCHLDLTCGPS